MPYLVLFPDLFSMDAPFICLANDYKMYYTLSILSLAECECLQELDYLPCSVYVTWYLRAQCISNLFVKGYWPVVSAQTTQ